MSIEAGIGASRVKTGIWVSRLGFESKGRDVEEEEEEITQYVKAQVIGQKRWYVHFPLYRMTIFTIVDICVQIQSS